ncbi:hypothetical protein V2J56_09100 [Georgenia sp. MJ206]|uniref:hypothetical protein n=1 Tax=Georgenia wangjunii TaxID=3117730 RepID=UPI002F2601E7
MTAQTVHLADDTRKPLAGHATYPHDHRHALGEVMGPNALREHLTVVEATYDPDADATRLGFTYATTDDVARAAKEA